MAILVVEFSREEYKIRKMGIILENKVKKNQKDLDDFRCRKLTEWKILALFDTSPIRKIQ
jgi:hypothetical protein